MPEIRLGAGENLVNVNLGAVEVEEVRLGTVLVWRNNVAPFLRVLVNGTQVDTNGNPMTPQDPRTPANAVLTNFTYNDTINIEAAGVVDEDMHYPVSIRLYAGDFEADDTLPVIQQGVVAAANGAVTVQVPRGPMPSGANAADFVYNDQLYTLVAEDAEEGITYIYFRITRADVPDQWNSGPWNNAGAATPAAPRVTNQPGLMRTFNTQCFDPMSTTETFTRTTTQNGNNQPQNRTNTYQVNGIDDRGTNPLRSQPVPTQPTTTRTIFVAVGGATTTEVVTGTTMQNNGAYVMGATRTNNVGSPGPIAAAPDITNTACTGAGCGFFMANCNGGTQVRTTQRREQPTNCAGGPVGAPVNVGAPIVNNQTCTYTNPVFLPAGSTGGIGPSALNNGGRFTGTISRDSGILACSFVCMDGSTPTAPNRTINCPAGMLPSVTGMPCNTSRSASGSCNVAATGGVMSGTCVVTVGGVNTTYNF